MTKDHSLINVEVQEDPEFSRRMIALERRLRVREASCASASVGLGGACSARRFF